MPCYQSTNLPGGVTTTGRTAYATEAECNEACKEGACCEGTTCTVKPQCQCQGTGQTFRGVGTTCAQFNGACCEGNSCSVKNQCECVGSGKIFKGIGSTCSPTLCYNCTGCCTPGAPTYADVSIQFTIPGNYDIRYGRNRSYYFPFWMPGYSCSAAGTVPVAFNPTTNAISLDVIVRNSGFYVYTTVNDSAFQMQPVLGGGNVSFSFSRQCSQQCPPTASLSASTAAIQPDDWFDDINRAPPAPTSETDFSVILTAKLLPQTDQTTNLRAKYHELTLPYHPSCAYGYFYGFPKVDERNVQYNVCGRTCFVSYTYCAEYPIANTVAIQSSIYLGSPQDSGCCDIVYPVLLRRQIPTIVGFGGFGPWSLTTTLGSPEQIGSVTLSASR